MASDLGVVEFIADQAGLGARLSYKRMFGEYAIYLDTKVVAFICDNKLYLKPTEVGRALLGSPVEAPPYPGAKNYFLLEQELEDPQVLRAALERTASVLPLPKPKSKPTPKSPSKPKANRKRSTSRGPKSAA
jgi:TfoX/Sxy family transcriptional regulator of competence genes